LILGKNPVTTHGLVGLEPASEIVEETLQNQESGAPGGADSGALSNGPSPTLSVLMKLAAGLTAEERSALARALQPVADESA
jgi:hypothetical protein